MARFLGETTAFEGVVRRGQVETPLGMIPAARLADGQTAEVHVRPEHVQVVSLDAAPLDVVRGTLRDVRLLGAVTALRVDVPDLAGGMTAVQALRIGSVALIPGADVAVRLDPALALVFPLSR